MSLIVFLQALWWRTHDRSSMAATASPRSCPWQQGAAARDIICTAPEPSLLQASQIRKVRFGAMTTHMCLLQYVDMLFAAVNQSE